MAKILISWVATANDFVKPSNAVNTSGPNCSVHAHFYDGYDRHVLLTTKKDVIDDAMCQRLVLHLKQTYKHKIEEIAMSISDPDLINISVISRAINTLLLTKYKNDEIYIFISPGTPAMQVAWYLAQMSLGLDIKLFQTVRPDKAKSVESARIWVTNDQIGYVSSLLFKEKISIEGANTSDKKLVSILKPIYQKASTIALADTSILITGETGTGKELLARHIHDSSHRKDQNFVAVNCAAFGNELLESRLFGHRKGAFTGALNETRGLFHEANGGTIFLDEIGDITPYMQQTLLRVLSTMEIMRVGSNSNESINVRVIAATNKDIYNMSIQGQYRADLYYRLATSEIELPSLINYSTRDKEEIFKYLWQKAQQALKRKDKFNLPASIKKQLMAYSYPGNIREMENIIYGIWAEHEPDSKHIQLPKRLLHPERKHSLKLKDIVFNHVQWVFTNTGNNISKTAELLGIQPGTVRTRLKK